MRRLLSTIAAMAAAGIIIPAATAVPVAQAAVVPQRLGLRLVQARGSAAHNPRARRYIVGYLRPGTVIHRSILIDNLGSATAHVAVYSGAARIRNGSFLASAGQTRSKLTSWIALRKSTYHLRRGASVTDLVTIRVPRQATPGDPGDLGEHYGVIWVQQVTHARGGAATKVSRVGIRIYLAVGRRAAPPTRFTVTSVTGHRYAGGRPLLTASVTNTGGRAVDLSGSARLTAGPGWFPAEDFSPNTRIQNQDRRSRQTAGPGRFSRPAVGQIAAAAAICLAPTRLRSRFPRADRSCRSGIPCLVVKKAPPGPPQRKCEDM